MPYNKGMSNPPCTVVEVPPFPSRADAVWSAAERHDFIDYIARNPEAGDPIVGTSGLRKVRWTIRGRGKRGGVRVIYFYPDADIPLFLLTVYGKSATARLTRQQEQTIAKLIPLLVRHYKGE